MPKTTENPIKPGAEKARKRRELEKENKQRKKSTQQREKEKTDRSYRKIGVK